MAKSQGQKLKLLYLIQILENYSDEEHPLSTAKLIEYLNMHGISSERKSIYDDIEKLMNFGYDIIQVPARCGGGYYLASREFELAELKLLVDAVQSSRFITTKKSRELISKLELKAGKHNAKKLQRQVYVAGRVKTENEGIYYSIDNIHRAIQEDFQISFVYMDFNINRELVDRDSRLRIVSPWALIWREENYYLAAYDEADNIIKHYRVDKMGGVSVLSDKRLGREEFEKIDLASYTNSTFGMFGGERKKVTLIFPVRLIGVVIDRFGRDADIRPYGNDRIKVRAPVAVSSQFFGWLAGIGKDAVIDSPETVRADYVKWLNDILESNRET